MTESHKLLVCGISCGLLGVGMKYQKWLRRYENGLQGKTVVLFGATGGIGKALCRCILTLGGELITVDRNAEKAKALSASLQKEFPQGQIKNLFADLADTESVKAVTAQLQKLEFDILVHNAGAYSIPRCTTSLGLDNVFQINFAAPYYVTQQLLPALEKRQGRVVAVGSIAHTYSKTDPEDTDFATRKRASLVYGNAKRYLMYAFLELSRAHPGVAFSVTHPGITFTNITNHYPKLIFAIIKHPMKVIFMPPWRAALNLVRGMFESTEPYSWIGPRFFDIWGSPKKKPLKTAKTSEIQRIFEKAQQIYRLWL